MFVVIYLVFFHDLHPAGEHIGTFIILYVLCGTGWVIFQLISENASMKDGGNNMKKSEHTDCDVNMMQSEYDVLKVRYAEEGRRYQSIIEGLQESLRKYKMDEETRKKAQRDVAPMPPSPLCYACSRNRDLYETYSDAIKGEVLERVSAKEKIERLERQICRLNAQISGCWRCSGISDGSREAIESKHLDEMRKLRNLHDDERMKLRQRIYNLEQDIKANKAQPIVTILPPIASPNTVFLKNILKDESFPFGELKFQQMVKSVKATPRQYHDTIDKFLRAVHVYCEEHKLPICGDATNLIYVSLTEYLELLLRDTKNTTIER